MANIQPRRNKEGKIISYSIRVYKGRDANGKQLKPYTMTLEIPEKWSEEKAKKEVEKAAIIFEKECREGIVFDNKQTFEQYSKYVIDLKARSGMRRKTVAQYECMLERINPAIGHIKINEIRPQHLNSFYDQLSQYGMNKTTGGTLSAASIKKHHQVIRTILSQAEKEMLVPYNAATKATIPKVIKKEANYLEIDTLEQILSYLPNESLRWQAVMSLLIFTGARRSEITGLMVKDIDFKNNTIRFRQSTHYTKKNGIYVDELKTESSKRILKVPKDVMNILHRLVRENKQKELLYGNKWENSGFLLVQENGKPIFPDSISDYCKKFEKKYNKQIIKKNVTLKSSEQIKLLPHLNPHAFRHSQASMLIYNGADIITVSKRLGHAQASTTTDIYSHILAKADETASTTLENLLIKKKLNFS